MGSRKFWLKVKSVFGKCGLRRLEGDEALYFKNNENGDLEGIVSTHVNDFNLAGTENFLPMVTEEIRKELDISKIEESSFRFTGIDVKKFEDRIELSMNNYAMSLEDVEIREDKSDEKLTREEMRVLRKYIGKLSWLAANMRPDLAIHTLELGKKQKAAVLKDLRSVNRILQKVREKESKVVFKKIAEKDDLCVVGISDTSYHQDENSVSGEMILLSNKKTVGASPLYWKSGVIRKICLSPKAAETRSLLRLVDDSMCLARQLSALMNARIETKIYTDSRPLLESIGSSGQIEEKAPRQLVVSLKQMLEDGEITVTLG